MFSRVAIFEDTVRDQKALQSIFEAEGCKTLTIPHARPTDEKERILSFAPELCVIDSEFTSEVDGIDIVQFCCENMPGIPLIVCTVLLNIPSRQDWINRRYENLPGVRAIFPKDPLPSFEEIRSVCNV